MDLSLDRRQLTLKSCHRHGKRRLGDRQSGFGLAEIMIGMAIGVLGVLAMMQVLALSENQRKNSQGSGDAQSNGTIALYELQRDIRQAGYGLSSLDLLNCNLTLPNGTVLNGLAPVTINHPSVPEGDVNTDTLLIAYGNSNGASEGDRISGVPSTDVYTLATPTSFSGGDFVMAAAENGSPPRAATCNLVMTTILASPPAPTPPASSLNVTAGTALTTMSGGRLYNLGNRPRMVVYAIRNATLTRCDLLQSNCFSTSGVSDATIWVPISSNIVSLRAQYGRDTATAVTSSPPSPAPSYVVSQFDQAAPANECDWIRTMAVRLVLVARSVQPDGSEVTPESPQWYASEAGNGGAGSTQTPIDLSETNSRWKHYRYRTFQTVAPIRNITWMGVKAGC